MAQWLTLLSLCRQHGLHPWSENLRSHMHMARPHGKMGKQWKQWLTLYFWALKSLQMVTAAMKLKDTCSLEEKL